MVSLSVMPLNCVKTSECIGVMFRVQTLGASRNIVLDGYLNSPMVRCRGSGRKFCPFHSTGTLLMFNVAFVEVLFSFCYPKLCLCCKVCDWQLTVTLSLKWPIMRRVGRQASTHSPLLLLQQVGRGSWRHWNELIKPAVTEGKKFQDILIPTMDTVRYSYMMDFFIKHERSAVQC